MFRTDLIVWLQSGASPAVTWAMCAISLFGYTRVLVAASVLLAFGWKFRPALAVLVLLGLNGVLTSTAKIATGTPRPDAVDGRVQPLGQQMHVWNARALNILRFSRPDEDNRNASGNAGGNAAVDAEGRYGFPSGHVSATTAFCMGLAVLIRRRWFGIAAAVWIVLMAFSRIYLGRHFLGDAVGGLAVGILTISVGIGLLGLRALTATQPVAARRAARTSSAFAIVITVAALITGVPDSGDAGRLLGITIAVLVLAGNAEVTVASGLRERSIRIAIAALGFGAAWTAVRITLDSLHWSSSSSGRLVASAVPVITMLLLPIFATEHRRSARRQIQ